MDKLTEKCGIFGVYGQGFEAARLVHTGLWALQHRGQESSGIAASDGKKISSHLGVGLVAHVFKEDDFKKLKGFIAIGHNRYSTSGVSSKEHCQPVIRQVSKGRVIALAHNGNLPSTKKLENFLKEKGIDYTSLNDSEMMTATIAYFINAGASLETAVKKAYPYFTGVFCFLAIDEKKMVAVRDQYGIRPFCLGKLNGGYVFSSESCALDTIGAKFLREIKPGEMVIADKNGLRSEQVIKGVQKLDVFEFVYFARPDSVILGKSVDKVRQNLGVQLAFEHPLHADLVIPVPDSAIPAALGYSRQSGIPYYPALIKNRYIHRTFIMPEAHTRGKTVQLKLNPMKHILKGKRVIVIDDSIVRGTTSKELITIIRKAGAKKIYLLISSPPVKYPDFYGINTPDQNELLAAKMSIPEMAKFVGADYLGFLSYRGLIKSTTLGASKLCTSCFTGKYPVDIGENKQKIVYQRRAKKSQLAHKKARNFYGAGVAV